MTRTVKEQRGLAWVRDISWHADLSFSNNCDQLDTHGASSEQVVLSIRLNGITEISLAINSGMLNT